MTGRLTLVGDIVEEAQGYRLSFSSLAFRFPHQQIVLSRETGLLGSVGYLSHSL